MSFSEIWKGRNKDFADDMKYSVSNIILGMTITIITILVLKLAFG